MPRFRFDTITQSGVKEPETRGEVFDIWLDGIKSPSDVIDAVEGCVPLTSQFQRLAADELEGVQSQLDDDDITPAKKRALQRLETALEDPDEGWKDCGCRSKVKRASIASRMRLPSGSRSQLMGMTTSTCPANLVTKVKR